MGQLKRHIDSHQGIRRYKCKVCEKLFSCPGKRKKHIKKMHPNMVVDGQVMQQPQQ